MMVTFRTNKERPVNKEEFSRAYEEAWPHISDKRKSKGFEKQKELLWNALQVEGLNIWEDDRYLGSLMFWKDQLDLNDAYGPWWVVENCLVGEDSRGSKAWYPKIFTNGIDVDISESANPYFPLNFMVVVSATSPIGQLSIKIANEIGSELFEFGDLFPNSSKKDHLCTKVIWSNGGLQATA